MYLESSAVTTAMPSRGRSPITSSAALLNPPRDAFARMYSWVDDLPGWCDRTEPVATALQAAEWVRIIYGELEHWRAAEQNHLEAAFEAADKAASGAPKLILAQLSGKLKLYHHPISERAKSALSEINDVERPRYLSPDDIQASKLLVDWWNKALLIRLARRPRLRSFVSDWSLLKYALLERMSMRAVAERVGLDRSGSGVASRIAEAIAAVAETAGEFPLDFPAPRLEWSKPRLLTPQTEKVACYTIIRRKNFEPKLLTAKRAPFQPGTDDRLLIAEHLKTIGVTRLPPGIADGVPHGSLRGDRTYDIEAGTVAISYPQKGRWPFSRRFNVGPEPVSDRATSYWRPYWSSKAHKRWCREGAVKVEEFRRKLGRYSVVDDDPPKTDANATPDMVDVIERSMERTDEFDTPGGEPFNRINRTTRNE
jgi:hypothetical protein